MREIGSQKNLFNQVDMVIFVLV